MFRKLVFIISLVVVLSAAGDASAELVAWWRFDDGSGATAMDSSGNGNDGTLEGGAQWTDGQIGGAIQFNGSDSRVVAPHIPLNNQSFTIAMWVNPVLYTNETVVFSQVQTNSQHLSMHYRLWGDGRVRMGFYSNDLDTVAGTVADNNWYHITFWYDFDNQDRRIYINGVEAARGSATPYLGASGNTVIGMWDNTAQWFRGIIDDVQIYDHPLSEAEILAAMRGLEGFPQASGANPKDGTLLEQTWGTLSWRAGDFAVSHDVYLSDDFEDVNAGAEVAFQGNKTLTDTTLIVGFMGFPYPDGLVPGTTYYWRIDEVNDADPNSPWIGDVWSFTVPPKTAYNESPVDAARFVAVDAQLSWTAGFGAKLHTVYFGDDLDTVSNATGGALISDTTFDPGPLESDKTYYWRVDEFEAPITHKGDVWSFTTVPDIPITDPNLVGWWKFDEGAGTVAVDSSGHDNHGELRGDPTWVEGTDGGALEFDGTGDYVDCGNTPSISPTTALSVMAWIKVNPWTKTWETILAKGDNSYRLSRSGSGNATHFGCGGTSGNYFDGSTIVTDNQWHHVCGVYDGATQTIYIDGLLDTAIPSTGSVTASTYSLFIGENSQATGRHITGLIDDVRLYNKPLTVEEIMEVMRGDTTLAGNPSPRNGALVDVKAATALTWVAGDNAVQQDVYLGTDRTAVEDADATDTTGIYRGRQAGTSFTPPEGLPWGTGPYFWRVDQVNNDGTIGTGRIWSFTVADFLIVDDFESYTDNDAAGEAIWQTWDDGFADPTNGSECAYPLPPYAEQTIVHSGAQSMPLQYNNTGGVTNSEVELTLDSAPRDWTQEQVAELSIWFHGQPASTGSFVEGPFGTYTMTGSGADI
ncbi:MAG: LamG domain-containing protein, partial [Phycisphaerales bacterium]